MVTTTTTKKGNKIESINSPFFIPIFLGGSAHHQSKSKGRRISFFGLFTGFFFTEFCVGRCFYWVLPSFTGFSRVDPVFFVSFGFLPS